MASQGGGQVRGAVHVCMHACGCVLPLFSLSHCIITVLTIPRPLSCSSLAVCPELPPLLLALLVVQKLLYVAALPPASGPAGTGTGTSTSENGVVNGHSASGTSNSNSAFGGSNNQTAAHASATGASPSGGRGAAVILPPVRALCAVCCALYTVWRPQI